MGMGRKHMVVRGPSRAGQRTLAGSPAREAGQDRMLSRPQTRPAGRALANRYHLTPNVSGKYEAFELQPPAQFGVVPAPAGRFVADVMVGPHT